MDLLICSFTPAGIICLFKALQRNSRDKILHPEHFLTERLINGSAIGKRQEFAVRMHLTDPDQIGLAYQRFPASINIHIGTQFLALADDGIYRFQTEVELVAILSCPTTSTMHIACRCGVQQNRPGDIAVFLLLMLCLDGTASETRIEQKVLEEGLPYTRVQLIDPQDQLVPVILLINDLGGSASEYLLQGFPPHTSAPAEWRNSAYCLLH